MASSDIKPEPIVATREEQSALTQLEQLLNVLGNGDRIQPPRIVSSEGEQIELPEPVLRLLRQAVHQLAQGKGVTISTFHQPLAT